MDNMALIQNKITQMKRLTFYFKLVKVPVHTEQKFKDHSWLYEISLRWWAVCVNLCYEKLKKSENIREEYLFEDSPMASSDNMFSINV